MPHVLLITAVVAFVYFGVRWTRHEYERVDASLRRAERRIRQARLTGHVTQLVFDSATGFYRPAE